MKRILDLFNLMFWKFGTIKLLNSKNMQNFIMLILFLINISYAQSYSYRKIIVDSETLMPIYNVHIYNDLDSSLSNDEGYFTFYSNDNQVIFNHLGYESQHITLQNLSSIDTVYLKPKLIQLSEVVILDSKNLIKSVYNKIYANYPTTSFDEESFIRCVLKKDGEVVKMQDLVVQKRQNSLFTTQDVKKLQYNFEIKNMRKAGIISKNSEDFALLSIEELYNWFSAIFTIPNYYNYIEDDWIDENHVKVSFQKNNELVENASLEGYYIINKSDLSFKQVSYKTVYEKIDLIPYKKDSNVKWRTIGNELVVDYKKDIFKEKYFINNATLKTKVEVINNGKKSLYEARYQVVNVKSKQKHNVNANVSPKRDMFEMNFKYDKGFWEKQNQLLLDNELINFIKGLNNLSKKDFRIYTNFR